MHSLVKKKRDISLSGAAGDKIMRHRKGVCINDYFFKIKKHVVLTNKLYVNIRKLGISAIC